MILRITPDGFEYDINADGTARIIGYHNTAPILEIANSSEPSSILRIPRTADMHRVSTIDHLYRYGNDANFHSMIIPPAVTTLRTGVIRSHKLREVYLPDSITGTTSCPFADCPNLTAIHILPTNPTLVYEDGILTDKEKTTLFYDIHAIHAEHYTVPAGFQKIAAGAFSCCSNLKQITIADSVTEIGAKAFSDCHSLTDIRLPSGLTNLGEAAFAECRSLRQITLPDTLTTLSERLFVDCHSLETIVIPESVTEIGPQAFSLCHQLAKVVLPTNLHTIGNEAFYECTNLKSIIFPDNLRTIGMSAFRQCSSLQEIAIPPGVHTAEGSAFRSCTAL